MGDFTPTVYVQGSTPAANADELNKLGAGIQDAAQHHKRGTEASMPAAAAGNKNWIWFATDTGAWYFSTGAAWVLLAYGWVDLDLAAVASQAIAVPAWAKEIEVEVDGRMSLGAGSQGFIMVQPSGGGTSLNGRCMRVYRGINSVEGTYGPTAENSVPTRDQGWALAVVENWPQDTLAKGTFSFGRTGVGLAHSTIRPNPQSDSTMQGDTYESMTYGIGQATTITVKFNVNAAAGRFTGKLRYQFRA